MKIIHITLLFILCTGLFAQKIKYNPPQTKEIIINYNDSLAVVNVLTVNKDIKTKEDLIYYWYLSNTIQQNMGGYQGKILHGEYSLFMSNNILVSKGKYNYGLKTGKWIYWYTNGNIKEICNWQDGKMNGANRFYDKNGNKIRELNYKNGKLDGNCYFYGKDTTISKKYVNGIESVQQKHQIFKWKNKSSLNEAIINETIDEDIENKEVKKPFSFRKKSNSEGDSEGKNFFYNINIRIKKLFRKEEGQEKEIKDKKDDGKKEKVNNETDVKKKLRSDNKKSLPDKKNEKKN